MKTVRCCLIAVSTVAVLAPLSASSTSLPDEGVARVVSEAMGGTIVAETLVGATLADGDDDERARADRRNRLRQGEAGTYIADILLERDSSLARWKSRIKPLTVWIQPASSVTDWTPEYIVEVRRAFEEWGALRLPLRFQFVSDSAKAEIHVSWIDRFNEPISGRTRWARDEHWWITDAGIVLAVHHHQGQTLDLDAMRAMALHEVGHLLGLDHTSDAGNIMAPRVRVRSLSDADRATVELLYSLPAGGVR